MKHPGKRRWIVSVALVVLWSGAILFFVGFFAPSLLRFRELQQEMKSVTTMLEARLRAGNIPSQADLQSAVREKESWRKEWEAAAAFYTGRRNALLERDILDAHTGDPYHVASRFRELKKDMDEQIGRAGFLDLGAVAAWVALDDGRPGVEQFPLLGEKTGIAQALVQVLTARGELSPTVRAVSVGDPYLVPGQPPQPSDETVRGLRFRVFPVEVAMSVRPETLMDLFADLTSVDAEDEQPLAVIRALELQAPREGYDGRLELQLGLNVLSLHATTVASSE